MAALGDVSRQVQAQPARIAATLAGALVGSDDFGREVAPPSGGSGPVLPTYGQIFPLGR